MGQKASTHECVQPPTSTLMCVVVAGARLMLRHGVVQVENLASRGEEVDVWSTEGWVKARIRVLGSVPAVRVSLSDGSAVECTLDTQWPVVQLEDNVGGGTPTRKGATTHQSPVEVAEVRSESARSPNRSSPVSNEPSQEIHQRRLPRAFLQSSTDVNSLPINSSRRLPHALTHRSSLPQFATLKTAWAARRTGDLETGDRITPYPTVPPEDIVGSAVTTEEAAAAGELMGGRVVSHKSKLPRLIDAVCGNADPGYSADAIRAYVDGWAVAQQGCLVGCTHVIADLQILLRRAGVNSTRVEETLLRNSLLVDPLDVWAKPPEEVRLWTRRLRKTHQTVVNVVEVGKKKTYAVELVEPTSLAIAVNNVMLCHCAT